MLPPGQRDENLHLPVGVPRIPPPPYEGMNVKEHALYLRGYLRRARRYPGRIAWRGFRFGTAHAVGYANRSRIPFTRPFIKYCADLAALLHAPKQSQRTF